MTQGFRSVYPKTPRCPRVTSRTVASRGDVLVEVDHDDELTPDCVAELAAAFAGPRVDFAYSTCCEIKGRTPWGYSENFG